MEKPAITKSIATFTNISVNNEQNQHQVSSEDEKQGIPEQEPMSRTQNNAPAPTISHVKIKGGPLPSLDKSQYSSPSSLINTPKSGHSAPSHSKTSQSQMSVKNEQNLPQVLSEGQNRGMTKELMDGTQNNTPTNSQMKRGAEGLLSLDKSQCNPPSSSRISHVKRKGGLPSLDKSQYSPPSSLNTPKSGHRAPSHSKTSQSQMSVKNEQNLLKILSEDEKRGTTKELMNGTQNNTPKNSQIKRGAEGLPSLDKSQLSPPSGSRMPPKASNTTSSHSKRSKISSERLLDRSNATQNEAYRTTSKDKDLLVEDMQKMQFENTQSLSQRKTPNIDTDHYGSKEGAHVGRSPVLLGHTQYSDGSTIIEKVSVLAQYQMPDIGSHPTNWDHQREIGEQRKPRKGGLDDMQYGPQQQVSIRTQSGKQYDIDGRGLDATQYSKEDVRVQISRPNTPSTKLNKDVAKLELRLPEYVSSSNGRSEDINNTNANRLGSNQYFSDLHVQNKLRPITTNANETPTSKSSAIISSTNIQTASLPHETLPVLTETPDTDSGAVPSTTVASESGFWALLKTFSIYVFNMLCRYFLPGTRTRPETTLKLGKFELDKCKQPDQSATTKPNITRSTPMSRRDETPTSQHNNAYFIYTPKNTPPSAIHSITPKLKCERDSKKDPPSPQVELTDEVEMTSGSRTGTSELEGHGISDRWLRSDSDTLYGVQSLVSGIQYETIEGTTNKTAFPWPKPTPNIIPKPAQPK